MESKVRDSILRQLHVESMREWDKRWDRKFSGESKSKQTWMYFKLSPENVEISAGCVTQVQKKRETSRKLKKMDKY